MQARAIFEAAVNVAKGRREGDSGSHDSAGQHDEGDGQPERDRPPGGRTGLQREGNQGRVHGRHDDRAAARRARWPIEIAEEAEFFSFGTNDLTQTAYGFSRDDISKFLPAYIERGILKQDPFATLDQEGVGELMQMAVKKGRKTRPNAEDRHLRRTRRRSCVGGVLPQDLGLNYVSCSPYPRADGASGSSAGSRGGRVEDGRRKDESST